MGKIKGVAVINVVKVLRMKKDEARKLLPEHLHGYLEDRVMPSSWYPEEENWELLRALARLLPDPGMDIYEYMGLITARSDLGGVYAHLIRQGDPATTLRRATFTWGLYHDTGKKEVIESGDDYVISEIAGFENPCRESCGTTKGWNAELAKMAGGKNVEVTHTKCVLDGASACRFEVRWTR